MLECHGICIASHKIVTVGGVSTGSSQHTRTAMGAIQVLRNAVGGGVRDVSFPGKKRYEGVWFNVISVTRGWVGVQFPGKNSVT